MNNLIVLVVVFSFGLLSLGLVLWYFLKTYFITMCILENYYNFSNPKALYETYLKDSVSFMRFNTVLNSLDTVPDYWKKLDKSVA